MSIKMDDDSYDDNSTEHRAMTISNPQMNNTDTQSFLMPNLIHNTTGIYDLKK